jgi:hypothetical protein
MYAVLAAPGAYRPTQSLDVGAGIPLHAAVSIPPSATIEGVALRVMLGALTVKLLLVARSV